MAALDSLINDKTFLVCCMLANNELGSIQDVEKLSAIAKTHGVLVMSDCVQALGKINIDIDSLGVDYATFSAHKVYGPKGVGAVYVREAAPLQALITGGEQESGRRAGTESVHNIIGMSEVCKLVPTLIQRMDGVEKKKSLLIGLIKEAVPDLQINSPERHCTANTLNITLPGVNNIELMAILDLYGISVSAGSACHTESLHPSHVLAAIGLEQRASETIRISLSPLTSEKDIRYAARYIGNAVNGSVPSIRFLNPSEVDRNFLYDENNYIIDIRFNIERKMMKALPNTHEASVINFSRYIHHLPRDKNIVIVCSSGIDAIGISFTLKGKGFQSVSTINTGVMGWRIAQPRLYRELSGLNVERLEPRR